MSEKQFVVEIIDRHLFTVKDTVNEKQVTCLEFNTNETSVYLSFMQLIQLMNDLADENRQLKYDYNTCKDKRQLYYINLDDLERIIIESISMCMTDVNAVVLAEKATYLKVNDELKKLNHTIKNAFRNFRELGES